MDLNHENQNNRGPSITVLERQTASCKLYYKLSMSLTRVSSQTLAQALWAEDLVKCWFSNRDSNDINILMLSRCSV